MPVVVFLNNQRPLSVRRAASSFRRNRRLHSALRQGDCAPHRAQRRIVRGEAPGLIHHSDLGSQYARLYPAQLVQAQLTPSMHRTGNCGDNAVIECFFTKLKAGLVDT